MGGAKESIGFDMKIVGLVISWGGGSMLLKIRMKMIMVETRCGRSGRITSQRDILNRLSIYTISIVVIFADDRTQQYGHQAFHEYIYMYVCVCVCVCMRCY